MTLKYMCDINKIENEIVWLEYCKSCKKKHKVTLQPCPSCGVYETPQPKSENVKDTCRASYSCDGCQAYEDHY